jgi:phenylpropionate dioxygenase-like ring-hydroxylating dioxygenase large terminal subunit
MTEAFNNPASVTRSWYVAARSRDVRAGVVKSYDLLGRRITLCRNARGAAYAFDAQCPHLGADLGHGRVVGDAVQCAFHGWRIGADGQCSAGGQALATTPARAYPVVERWGLIWIFNGPRALFDLPDLLAGAPATERLRAWRLPPQHIDCHPHLVIANGLDIAHYGSLHRMRFTAPPRWYQVDDHRLTLEMCGRPLARWQQVVTSTGRRDLVASFTTVGGNLAWANVAEPLRFHLFFAGRPANGGGCDTQTVLFCRRRDLPRALALMYVLLYDDHRILNGLQFTPNFTAQDAPLKAFAELVNRLGVW